MCVIMITIGLFNLACRPMPYGGPKCLGLAYIVNRLDECENRALYGVILWCSLFSPDIVLALRYGASNRLASRLASIKSQIVQPALVLLSQQF